MNLLLKLEFLDVVMIFEAAGVTSSLELKYNSKAGLVCGVS